MNTTAKIIIAVLVFLVVFLGIYSFIKAKEADKLNTTLLEVQQIAIIESERAKSFSDQAVKSAADAIKSAAEAEMSKMALKECEKMKK